MTKVKICGITNLEDALLSAKFGADALGFNFYEKSPRYIAPEKARDIIAELSADILKVGVFVNESLERIAEIAGIAGLDALQLHGEEPPEFARELKTKTNLEIIKAFRVSPEFKPESILQYEVDAILLDAYNPKEHGGTGETFDWGIAKKVQQIFPKIYLAGGLKHENVNWAIDETDSFAVDVCSGIEIRGGVKDKVKLINFISKVKNSDLRNPEDNFSSFLAYIHRYPQMYVGEKSISLLRIFFIGFETALKYSKSEYNTNSFFTDFDEFIRWKYKENGAWGWDRRILEKVNNDEEKAVDLFFALLEEFKLEKEELGKD